MSSSGDINGDNALFIEWTWSGMQTGYCWLQDPISLRHEAHIQIINMMNNNVLLLLGSLAAAAAATSP